MNCTAGGHLRSALDVNSPLGAFTKHGRIAKHQRVAGNAAILLAITLNLGAKIHAHGCQRPADVVAVEMVRDSIQIFLAKNAIGMNHLVASEAASGYKHNQHAGDPARAGTCTCSTTLLARGGEMKRFPGPAKQPQGRGFAPAPITASGVCAAASSRRIHWRSFRGWPLPALCVICSTKKRYAAAVGETRPAEVCGW